MGNRVADASGRRGERGHHGCHRTAPEGDPSLRSPSLSSLRGTLMSISVRCPGCEKGMGVPEKYAGRSVKCPACKTPIDVPGGDRPQRSRQPAGAAAGEGGGRRAPSRGKPTRSGGGRPAGDRGGTKRPKRAVSNPDTDGDFLGGLDLDRIDRAGEIEICPKCATELREDSDICPKCGFGADYEGPAGPVPTVAVD